MKESPEGFSQLLPSVMGVKSVHVGLRGFPTSREYVPDDEDEDEDDGRIDQVAPLKRGTEGGEKVAHFQASGGSQFEAEGVLGGWKGFHFRHSGSISL